MIKEKYQHPQSAEIELVWTAVLCLSDGTESFSTGDDLVYPNDFWE
ncbi:MAG: hypothetical protein MJY41_01355 [Bacteroidales bacterium]|nr:hypothetical protein [Bacteroidales bacterium]